VKTSGTNPIALANAAIAASLYASFATKARDVGSPATNDILVAAAIRAPIIASRNQFLRILETLSENVVTSASLAPAPSSFFTFAAKTIMQIIPASIAIPKPFRETFAVPMANVPNFTTK